MQDGRDSLLSPGSRSCWCQEACGPHFDVFADARDVETLALKTVALKATVMLKAKAARGGLALVASALEARRMAKAPTRVATMTCPSTSMTSSRLPRQTHEQIQNLLSPSAHNNGAQIHTQYRRMELPSTSTPLRCQEGPEWHSTAPCCRSCHRLRGPNFHNSPSPASLPAPKFHNRP